MEITSTYDDDAILQVYQVGDDNGWPSVGQ